MVNTWILKFPWQCKVFYWFLYDFCGLYELFAQGCAYNSFLDPRWRTVFLFIRSNLYFTEFYLVRKWGFFSWLHWDLADIFSLLPRLYLVFIGLKKNISFIFQAFHYVPRVFLYWASVVNGVVSSVFLWGRDQFGAAWAIVQFAPLTFRCHHQSEPDRSPSNGSFNEKRWIFIPPFNFCARIWVHWSEKK